MHVSAFDKPWQEVNDRINAAINVCLKKTQDDVLAAKVLKAIICITVHVLQCLQKAQNLNKVSMNRSYVESMCAQAKCATYFEYGGEADPVAQAFKVQNDTDLEKAKTLQEQVEVAVLTWHGELHKDTHARRVRTTHTRDAHGTHPWRVECLIKVESLQSYIK